MQKIKQRKSRDFDTVKSLKEVIETLKKSFSKKGLFIKFAVDNAEISINEFFPDGTMMLIADPMHDNADTLVVYGLSDKYLELDLEVLEKRASGYLHCKVKSARRASSGRRDLRFKVAEDEVVATNFGVSKHSIDVTNYKMPTVVKVVLEQYKKNNSSMADIVKIDVFDSKTSDGILKMIKKTGKTLYIEDTSNPDCYDPFTDDFLDLKKLYGEKLSLVIKKHQEKGHKSILIVPIIYITDDEKSIPFAYIQLVSKSQNFGIDKVLEIKENTFSLVDRIRDANTVNLPVHQHIVDISRGGVKIKITDNNLKRYFLKTKGFILDIVFKLQAPITMYGEIKVTYTDENGDLFVGVDFEGNSSRKDQLKRFYAVLKPMEAKYKSDLIKKLRAKQK